MRVRRLIARPEAALFALVFATYAYFYQAGGWNQNSRFDMVRAIVEAGTSSIDRFRTNTGDLARRDGHYYCEKAPAVSWLGVPAYAATRALAGQPTTGPELDRAAYVTTLWAVALPSAIAVVTLVYLLGLLGLSRNACFAGAAAYGLGTLVLPYSTLFYGEQLSGALLLVGFTLLVGETLRGLPRAGRLVAAGALLGGGVLADFPAALAVVVLSGLAAWRIRSLSRLAWFAAGGAVAGALLLTYNALVFGGPLTLPYHYSLMPYRHMGVFMGIGPLRAGALWQITFSPYRGLFFSAPWLLLALPGAYVMIRDRRTRPVAIACALVVLLLLWMNASLSDPLGGWAMGPRFMIPALPFWAVLAAGVLLPLRGEGARWRPWALRGLFAASAAYAVALMLVGTAVKPEVPLQIHHPFGDYLLPAFARGDLAVSTQGIDMAAMPPHAPTRAWNLGQQLGLPGLWSLLPLALVAAAAAAWLLASLRRE